MVSASPCHGEYTGSIPVQDSISVGTRIGIAHCLRNNGLWVRIPPYRLIFPWRNKVAQYTLNVWVLGSSPSGRTLVPSNAQVYPLKAHERRSSSPSQRTSVNMDLTLKLPPAKNSRFQGQLVLGCLDMPNWDKLDMWLSGKRLIRRQSKVQFLTSLWV